MTAEKAIEWMEFERLMLERAPEINGCPMTDDWQTAIDVYKIAIAAVSAQVEKKEQLTLGELLKMDSEPVWIKLLDLDEEFWVLRNEWADTRAPDQMILFHMRWYLHRDYGKTWLAYRRKPDVGNEPQKAMGEWISVMDRLPKTDGIYIVCDRRLNGEPWIHTAGFRKASSSWCELHGVYYDDGYGRYSEQDKFTHWMTMPEPPEEGTA